MQSFDNYIVCNGAERVPPVPRVRESPSWPPAWLTELSAKIPQPTPPPHPRSRGWRLNNGTTICACCHSRPAGATAVILQETADGLVWVDEVPTSTREITDTVSGSGCDNSTSCELEGSGPAPNDDSRPIAPPAGPEATALGEGWL